MARNRRKREIRETPPRQSPGIINGHDVVEQVKTTTRNPGLFILPLELRLIIYEYVFMANELDAGESIYDAVSQILPLLVPLSYPARTPSLPAPTQYQPTPNPPSSSPAKPSPSKPNLSSTSTTNSASPAAAGNSAAPAATPRSGG